MTSDIPESITTPDRVETRLGTLKSFDGLPDAETVERVYDNLDFQRGVQAFLTAVPAAAMHAMREGYRTYGRDNRAALVSESLMDAETLALTGNSETVYTMTWLDTRDGPLVIETPPNVLGLINDSWMRYVADVGNAGPDRGEGGRYLLLSPGFQGDVPEGYFVVRSRTYGNLLYFRGFLENGDAGPAIARVREHYRVYPLEQAQDPPRMEFVDFSGKPFNGIHSNDFTFYEEVAAVVESEPLDSVDPEVRGLLAAIGIRKGEPFAPDERMKRILIEAVAVGNATARALAFHTRDREAYVYPDSAWKILWVGYDYRFSPGGVLNLDARSMYCYVGMGVSPAMAVKMVGAGSQYIVANQDADGRYLDGGKQYRLHLPPNVPAKDFWSVVVYDPQTRSMLRTDQRFPSTGSQKEDLEVNADGSVDVYFGPEPPAGKEANWVQTVPGKGWFAALRLYGPLEPWFDKSWKPGEIERVG